MTDIFVYATLRSRLIQRKAMGHSVHGRHAYIRGFREISISHDCETWPTIISSMSGVTGGELLDVSNIDVSYLDDWEVNYKRVEVVAEPMGEPAFAYKFDPDREKV